MGGVMRKGAADNLRWCQRSVLTSEARCWPLWMLKLGHVTASVMECKQLHLSLVEIQQPQLLMWQGPSWSTSGRTTISEMETHHSNTMLVVPYATMRCQHGGVWNNTEKSSVENFDKKKQDIKPVLMKMVSVVTCPPLPRLLMVELT